MSLDEKDWIKVIDHSQYFCRSWQYLYFEPKVVLYIRIVGTNNTVNKVSINNKNRIQPRILIILSY